MTPRRVLLTTACATWLALPACHRSADRDLPGPYRTVGVPQGVLTSPDARARGAALFHAHCTLCHGEHGDGHGLQRMGLDPKPRDLTDPAWRRSTSARRVFHAIREGVRGTAMPSWRSLSQQDAWDLTAYVLALSHGPGT